MNTISKVPLDQRPGKIAENIYRFAARHVIASVCLALFLKAAASRNLPAAKLLQKWNYFQLAPSIGVYGIFAFNSYHSSNNSHFLHATLSAVGIVLLTSGFGASGFGIATLVCSRLKLQNGFTHVASHSWQPLLACFVTSVLISKYIGGYNSSYK